MTLRGLLFNYSNGLSQYTTTILDYATNYRIQITTKITDNQISTTTSSMPREIKCPMCHQLFFNDCKYKQKGDTTLWVHIKKVHLNTKKVIPSKSLATTKYIRKPSGKVYENRKYNMCKICKVKFFRTVDEYTHKCGIKFKCPRCNKDYKSITHLQFHVSRSKKCNQ